MTPEFQPKISPAKVRSICNIAGAVILVIGLISAAWIWQTQGRQQADPETSALPGSLSPDDSARYQRQVEIYSGKVGLLVERWTRQAAELGHGKALAETLQSSPWREVAPAFFSAFCSEGLVKPTAIPPDKTDS